MQKNNHRVAQEKQEKKENFSQVLVSKFLPYWPLFLLFAILSVAGAYVYLQYATPIYQATATLLIKDEKKGPEDSKLSESLDMISSKKIVENEIEVIQSRTLMDNVVKIHHLYAPVFEHGKVNTISAYTISPIIIEVKTPDSVRQTGKINFSYDKAGKTVLLNNK